MAMINFPAAPIINGEVAKGFESVRHAFQQNFLQRGETGAACTIYHKGVKVVDLWGGYQCSKSEKQWDDATLTTTFSVTKGMAAAAMAVAHSRGLYDLDERVAKYWPEFGQNGKERITVRQLLDHQAGLISIRPGLNTERLSDADALANIIARQRPQWTPGTRHGYHTLSLGWYQSELIRRVDPKNRSIGRYFADEIARPLGVDFFIGLPRGIDEDRLSTIEGFHRITMLRHLHELPPKMVLAGIWPRSLVSKSIRILRVDNPAELASPDYRHLEIPSANGIGQARAVAKIYAVLAGGGGELNLNPASYRELISPASLPSGGTYDAILTLKTKYNLGFSKPSRDFQFGIDDRAFGCPGAGGSFGMGDPAAQVGFAYLTNKMGYRLFDDPREKAVRDACYECVAAITPRRAVA